MVTTTTKCLSTNICCLLEACRFFSMKLFSCKFIYIRYVICGQNLPCPFRTLASMLLNSTRLEVCINHRLKIFQWVRKCYQFGSGEAAAAAAKWWCVQVLFYMLTLDKVICCFKCRLIFFFIFFIFVEMIVNLWLKWFWGTLIPKCCWVLLW